MLITMTNRYKIVSATIVAFCINFASWAAPQNTMPDQSPAIKSEEPSRREENMNVTKPQMDADSSLNQKFENFEFFPFRQSLTVRMGAAAPVSDFKDTETIIGFTYMFPKFLSPRFEAGADVHNKDDKGHVHAGFREIFFERDRLRPSLKYGVSHEVHANEGLGSFANNKHYFGRGSAALDYSLNQDLALRVEVEALVGIAKQWASASAGLSFCW